MSDANGVHDLGGLEGFDEEINALMQEWNVSGAAISVFNAKELIFAKGFGMRDSKKGLEVNGDTLFRLASNTKAFTAMSICLLVNEGKLDLDKPIKHYMPSFKMYDSFATERLTPRDLLSHRTGLPAHDGAFRFPNKSRGELMELLQYLEPNHDPRSVLQYSNNMYMTAGYLVEHITGIPWETFIQERIFKPLGMLNSSLSAVKARNTGNYAVHTYEKDGKLCEYQITGDDPEKSYPRSPAGSVNASLHDLNQWMLLHLNRGSFNNEEFISEAIFNQMVTPQMVDRFEMPFAEVNTLCSGLGWFTLNYRGFRLVTHGGFFGTSIHFIPEKGIGIIYLPTLYSPLTDFIPYILFDRLLGLPKLPWTERYKEQKVSLEAAQRQEREAKSKEAAQIKETHPSHALEAYTGVYLHPAYGELSVTLEGDKLVHADHREKLILEHYHYDTFELVSEEYGPQIKVTFYTNAQGVISSASAPMEPAVKDIVFVKI